MASVIQLLRLRINLHLGLAFDHWVGRNQSHDSGAFKEAFKLLAARSDHPRIILQMMNERALALYNKLIFVHWHRNPTRLAKLPAKTQPTQTETHPDKRKCLLWVARRFEGSSVLGDVLGISIIPSSQEFVLLTCCPCIVRLYRKVSCPKALVGYALLRSV
ncbi:hypothetical protein BDP27DRAFT_1359016 [Rhodocollybia butyracea]|uniref:Transposase n=1 Tax=Rhodocollybia butyracea TaxID=206335 RepID=A0A9P5Q4K5_9AGAR|nr:hypothetical protein BDP27DRAFT_1359016 [Rhodocollybia butyracea]